VVIEVYGKVSTKSQFIFGRAIKKAGIILPLIVTTE